MNAFPSQLELGSEYLFLTAYERRMISNASEARLF